MDRVRRRRGLCSRSHGARSRGGSAGCCRILHAEVVVSVDGLAHETRDAMLQVEMWRRRTLPRMGGVKRVQERVDVEERWWSPHATRQQKPCT